MIEDNCKAERVNTFKDQVKKSIEKAVMRMILQPTKLTTVIQEILMVLKFGGRDSKQCIFKFHDV